MNKEQFEKVISLLEEILKEIKELKVSKNVEVNVFSVVGKKKE